jgi:predicted transcriptional regulator
MAPIHLPKAIDWREEVRFLAYTFKHHGWTQRRIAEVLDVSPSTVSQWLKRAQTGGIEALRNREKQEVA